MGYNFGKKSQSMKGTGETIKQTDLANFSIQTGIFMRENGRTIKRMAMGHTPTRMEQGIMESGRMISSTVLEWKGGLIMQSMRGSIVRERNMARAS